MGFWVYCKKGVVLERILGLQESCYSCYGRVGFLGMWGHVCPCLLSLINLFLRVLQTRFLEYSTGQFHWQLHYPALVASMPPLWLLLGMSGIFYRRVLWRTVAGGGRTYRIQTLPCTPNIHNLLVLTSFDTTRFHIVGTFWGRMAEREGCVVSKAGHIHCPSNVSASPILPPIGFSLWAQEKAISLMPSAWFMLSGSHQCLLCSST